MWFEASARELGIEHFGAHDLRRTCAKLCRKNGGDLEQIKFLLGHASIQTTERYLGSEQELAVAVNDNLGLCGSPAQGCGVGSQRTREANTFGNVRQVFGG